MFNEKTAPQNDDFAPASLGASACPAPVTPLEFEGKAVRMSVDESGNPWWVANDVCDVLGIANPRDAMSRLSDDEKGVALTDTPGGPQELALANEPGVYRLVMRSRKPEAEAFRRWLFHEVIPSIRRHGFYVRPGQDPVVALMETLRDRRLAELKLAREQEALSRRVDGVARTAGAALAVAQSNHGHYSVLGWARLCEVEMDLPTASRVGKALTGICERRGLTTGRVRDPRFGSVRTYPESVLRDYFGDILDGEANL